MTDLPGTRSAVSPRLLARLFLGAVVLAVAAAVVAVVMLVTSSYRPATPRMTAAAMVMLAHHQLAGTMRSVQAGATACQTDLPCVTRQYRREGKAFLAFGSALRQASMPAGGAAASARLRQDTARLAADFGALSTATSGRQFQELIASRGLMQAQAQFSADYQRLSRALGTSGAR